MKPTALPDTALRIARLLGELGHDRPVVMLESTGKTSAEAALALNCAVAEIAKSIVFRRKADDSAVVVIASGIHRIDERKVAALVGEIGKADAKFVKERLGFAIGGVSPIGHIGHSMVLIDSNLLQLQSVWAAAGHPHAVFNLTPAQLLRMTGAPVQDLVELA
jgi:prolyl-tRNA editing enzyme YbaK/EbsC (Cys-tRNA(Pro) deacylase)